MTRPSAPVLTGAGFVLVWLVLSCLDTQIAFARTSMILCVDILGWKLDAGFLPSLIALGLVGLIPPQRLGHFTSLTAVLCLLRIMSIWQPIGVLLPFLSVLWSPHASWALVASLLVALAPRLRALGATEAACRQLTPRRMALGIFTVSSVLYGGWALYVSQLTMVRGDEAHYMLATQSLLRDGDIDLHNNATRENIAEFRVLPFDLHRAPSSPAGTSYSIHPPGLSVLLLPAYAAGVHLWQNPRLACSLFMAMVSAAALSLLFLWLVRLGFRRALALVTIGILATTAPTVFFSVQIYPDIVAVLAAALVLMRLSRWQIACPVQPETEYPETGYQGPLTLATLTLMLGTLPLLHPRFLPLSALLGLPLVLQARSETHSRRSILAVAGTASLCVGAMLAYNLVISGDWLGHMRPGNAWDDKALMLSTWPVSLPGHWLHATKGLVANAPVMLLALVGAGWLLSQRDRRLLVALALYASTVVINGTHHDWGFGFAMPARFMMSGVPALCLLLCAGLGVMLKRLSTTFFSMFLLAMSWETLRPVLTVPTMAYDGAHLILGHMGRFYPLEVHLPAGEAAIHLTDGLLWAIVAFALFALGHGLGRRWRVVVALIAAMATPALWGLTAAGIQRLNSDVSPYLVAMSPQNPQQRGFAVQRTVGLTPYQSNTGQQDDGIWWAQPQTHAPGLLTSHYLPFQRPGVHEVSVNDFVVGRAEGPPDHVVFTTRRTLPVVQPWETRHYLPVSLAEGVFRRPYIVEGQSMGHVYFPFSGRRPMSVGAVETAFHSVPVHTRLHTLEALTPTAAGSGAAVEHTLPRGRYRARFRLEGSALGTLLQPNPVPVMVAAFTGQPSDSEELRRHGARWLREDRRLLSVFSDPQHTQPVVERLQAPWWIHVPGSSDAYDVVFSVPDSQRVHLLMRYDGPADLHLSSVTLLAEEILP